MKLYLVRHAQALSEAEDPQRPLSAQGRETTRAIGRWLLDHVVVDVEEVWHSPLARSRETAALLAESLKLRAPLREVPGLEPEDNPAGTAKALQRHKSPLLVVGHEPSLGGLVGLLLGVDPALTAVEFEKAGVLCLERVVPNAPWTLAWYVTPKLLRLEG